MSEDDYEFRPLKARAIQPPPTESDEIRLPVYRPMPPPPEFQDLPEPKKPRKRIGPFGKLVGYLALFALAAGTVASINNAIAGSLNNNAVAPAVSPSASETPVTTPTPTPTPTPTKLAVDRGDYGVAAVQPVKHKKKKKKVAKPRPTPVSVPVSNSGYVRRTRG